MSDEATFRDLRAYIDKLEEEDLLKRVAAEVDAHLEIGAITRMACEQRAAAPLFENVTGYPDHRVLGVVMGPSRPSIHARVAVALGAHPDAHPLDLIELVREKISNPRAPMIVDRSEAPCKEIVRSGADADLSALPVPWIKSVDGGPYVGTWDIVVTRDPETGRTNWGVYRCMTHDEASFTILLFPSAQHGGGTLAKYQAEGKPMPLALVIGADPSSQLAAITLADHDVSESELAGGFLGEPVPVTRCETSDLLVPATAEIVVEAEILPGERAPEGPFGEYTGHAAQRGTCPLARVRCITHRERPIFTMANMSKPWDDAATPTSLLASACIKDRLEAARIPVKSVYLPAPVTAIVVSARPSPGLAARIFAEVYSGHRMFTNGLVVVDEDVDVTSVEDVWWAIATRMHPRRMKAIHDLPLTNPLIPYLTPDERATRETSAWIMDATFPADWSPEYRDKHTRVVDLEGGWTDEVQRLVRRRWTEYGYDEPSARAPEARAVALRTW